MEKAISQIDCAEYQRFLQAAELVVNQGQRKMFFYDYLVYTPEVYAESLLSVVFLRKHYRACEFGVGFLDYTVIQPLLDLLVDNVRFSKSESARTRENWRFVV